MSRDGRHRKTSHNQQQRSMNNKNDGVESRDDHDAENDSQ